MIRIGKATASALVLGLATLASLLLAAQALAIGAGASGAAAAAASSSDSAGGGISETSGAWVIGIITILVFGGLALSELSDWISRRRNRA